MVRTPLQPCQCKGKNDHERDLLPSRIEHVATLRGLGRHPGSARRLRSELCGRLVRLSDVRAVVLVVVCLAAGACRSGDSIARDASIAKTTTIATATTIAEEDLTASHVVESFRRKELSVTPDGSPPQCECDAISLAEVDVLAFPSVAEAERYTAANVNAGGPCGSRVYRFVLVFPPGSGDDRHAYIYAVTDLYGLLSEPLGLDPC